VVARLARLRLLRHCAVQLVTVAVSPEGMENFEPTAREGVAVGVRRFAPDASLGYAPAQNLSVASACLIVPTGLRTSTRGPI